MNTQQAFSLYKWFALFLFIHSMYPWFTLGIDIVTLHVIAAIILFCVFSLGNIYTNSKAGEKEAVLFCLLFLWIGREANVFGFLQALISSGIVASFIFLKEEFKIKVIRFITRGFAVILLVSMVGYIAFILGVKIPYDTIAFKTYVLENHYLFVTSPNSILMRFRGPFLEPGHVTMGIAPLLFINRYNLKDKYVLILFVAQLLTLSLAGYITLATGFLLQMLLDKNKIKNKATSIVMSFVFLLFAFSFMRIILSENIIEEAIIERLQWEDGKLSGDDRSSDFLDMQYQNLLKSPEILTGHPTSLDNYEKGVASYKLFVVNEGMIGVLIAVLSYLSVLLSVQRGKRRAPAMLLLILFMLLYQNAYPVWWCMFISATMGVKYMENQIKQVDIYGKTS